MVSGLLLDQFFMPGQNPFLLLPGVDGHPLLSGKGPGGTEPAPGPGPGHATAPCATTALATGVQPCGAGGAPPPLWQEPRGCPEETRVSLEPERSPLLTARARRDLPPGGGLSEARSLTRGRHLPPNQTLLSGRSQWTPGGTEVSVTCAQIPDTFH